MAKYRHGLPQLSEDLFLTDGGLETTLIFQDGVDLPYFAAIDALGHELGKEALASLLCDLRPDRHRDGSRFCPGVTHLARQLGLG